jgi:hypothetical protein
LRIFLKTNTLAYFAGARVTPEKKVLLPGCQLVVAQVHHHPIFESQLESEADDEDSEDLGNFLLFQVGRGWVVGGK